jgi:copper(I)-binding protein
LRQEADAAYAHSMRGLAATALILAAALAGCGSDADAPPRVTVEQAIVTLPGVAGRPGAAYFTLQANRAGIRFVALSTPAARRVELHESGMRPAGAFVLSPAEPLAFSPGGRHAMLSELDPALRAGGRVTLTFTFAGAPPVTAEAEVRAPGDVPMHMGH